jgi:hypothetical protein
MVFFNLIKRFIMRLFYLYILILFFSCNKQSIDTDVHVVDMTETTDNLYLSKIVNDIEYIPLETNQEVIINRISKIQYSHDQYFVQSSNRLFIFDKNGKFISQINRQGRGPDEYLGIADFGINSHDSLIYLVTRGNGYNLDRYSLSGSFISRIKLDGFVLAAEIFEDKLFVFNDGEKEKCIDVIDIETGHVIDSFLKIRGKADWGLILLKEQYFSKSRNMLFFSRVFGNEIFQLNSEGVKIKYFLDFQYANFPNKEFRNKTEITDKDLARYKSSGYVQNIEWFFVNESFINVIFIRNNKVMSGFHIFNENKTYVVDFQKLKNDIDFGMFPYKIYDDEHYIYCAISSDEILTYYYKYGKSELKHQNENHNNKFIELVNKITEMDNPIIMKMRKKNYLENLNICYKTDFDIKLKLIL